jgi:hypothetical protein
LTLRFLNIVESVWGFYWGRKLGPYAFLTGYLDYRRSLYRFLRVHCIVEIKGSSLGTQRTFIIFHNIVSWEPIYLFNYLKLIIFLFFY